MGTVEKSTVRLGKTVRAFVIVPDKKLAFCVDDAEVRFENVQSHQRTVVIDREEGARAHLSGNVVPCGELDEPTRIALADLQGEPRKPVSILRGITAALEKDSTDPVAPFALADWLAEHGGNDSPLRTPAVWLVRISDNVLGAFAIKAVAIKFAEHWLLDRGISAVREDDGENAVLRSYSDAWTVFINRTEVKG